MPTITLEDVFARAAGRVRLLKLDCEGSEYAILENANLSGVERVCGEVHEIAWRGRDWTIKDVAALLGPNWGMELYKNGPQTWLFWGRSAA